MENNCYNIKKNKRKEVKWIGIIAPVTIAEFLMYQSFKVSNGNKEDSVYIYDMPIYENVCFGVIYHIEL